MNKFNQDSRSTGDRSIPARAVGGGRGDAEAVSRPAPAGSTSAPVREARIVRVPKAEPPVVKKRFVTSLLDGSRRALTDAEIAEWDEDFPITVIRKPARAVHRALDHQTLKPTFPVLQTSDASKNFRAAVLSRPAEIKAPDTMRKITIPKIARRFAPGREDPSRPPSQTTTTTNFAASVGSGAGSGAEFRAAPAIQPNTAFVQPGPACPKPSEKSPSQTTGTLHGAAKAGSPQGGEVREDSLATEASGIGTVGEIPPSLGDPEAGRGISQAGAPLAARKVRSGAAAGPNALAGVSPLAVAAALGSHRNEATAEYRLEQRGAGSSEAYAASPAPASARSNPAADASDGPAARRSGASQRGSGPPGGPSLPPDDPERLLTEAEVAAWTGLARGTLRNWRCSGKKGPRFLRLGRSIRYRRGDVADWIAVGKR
jgi:predicted DNA-binding transcriptional regulator AlpA